MSKGERKARKFSGRDKQEKERFMIRREKRKTARETEFGTEDK